jgi:hypothetical protein
MQKNNIITIQGRIGEGMQVVRTFQKARPRIPGRANCIIKLSKQDLPVCINVVYNRCILNTNSYLFHMLQHMYNSNMVQLINSKYYISSYLNHIQTILLLGRPQ